MPEASAAVWRTTDRGDTWTRSDAGLPQEDAYVSVLREAMARDTLDPVGVTFGTKTGQLWHSSDEGATWRLITDNLPEIWAVEAVVRRVLARPRATWRPSSSRARSCRCSRASNGAMRWLAPTVGEVHRPRSTMRRPGMRDRLVEAGPRLRPHINVFVDGQPADLDTPVGDGATVHVIPAVSGG